MPRNRTKEKHLPANVHKKHNAYYFVDKKRKWHRLGRTLPEAMQKWADIVEPFTSIQTMNELFDRYMLEVAPKKSPATFKNNSNEVKFLRAAFGEMSPDKIKPVHVYGYIDLRSKKAPVRANREKSLLSHVFSLAIRWGIVDDNPCRNVKRITEKKRNRYIEDWEFNAVKSIASPAIQDAMDLAYLTGLRRGDLLSITMQDITDEGILVTISKDNRHYSDLQAKRILIAWSDELKKIVSRIEERNLNIKRTHLISSRKNKPYTADGFKSIWQRVMAKALEEKLIAEKFRFHDIRRKAATDAEKLKGREFARHLLAHTDQKTTAIYISGVQRVDPLR